MRVDNVAIIGVGLIGGSFGMALRKRKLAGKVIGIGRSPERLHRAVDLGAIDSWSTDVESGVEQADLIYVATPVGTELDFIARASASAKTGCTITDAGSTKSEICRGADGLVPDGVSFVGGHPMAGSEEAGVQAAHPDLFVNAAYVLTPTERTDPEALASVRSLVEGIGARAIVMDPETHDRCAAVISHLPHLIAAALVSLARDASRRDPQIFDLIAGSFRDMTRVSSSSPVLWRDICLTNVEAIRNASEDFQRLLDKGLQAVESGDGRAFEDWFGSAKQVRDSLLPGNSENAEARKSAKGAEGTDAG